MEDDLKILRIGFNRRWRNLTERSEKFGVAPGDKEEVWKKLVEHYKSGFYCEYCGVKMHIKSIKTRDPFVWSIEHKIPLSEGGTNDLNNIVFACHRCNLVKGTLPGWAWEIMVQSLKATLSIEEYEEAMQMGYRGALANKIERAQNEGEEK